MLYRRAMAPRGIGTDDIGGGAQKLWGHVFQNPQNRNIKHVYYKMKSIN